MRVVIAGGGTGGHLFPGIAIAEELKRRGAEVVFVGTARGIESRVVPQEGFPLELIDVGGLKGKGLLGLLRGLARVPRALLQSRAILLRHRPDLVIGVGGYASGPMVLAAALARRPTAILEQNSVPGITNRILGRLVRAVFAAFGESRRYFPARKVRLAGNPIRARLREALIGDDAAMQQHEGRSLLVCGGSQGAHPVNELVVEAIALLAAEGRLPGGLKLVHQTGKDDAASVAERYRSAGVVADVRAFIDDMASAYRGADLVIGRAGATTIAELTALGRASLLIPFPQAADDHQTVNARSLERAGAARVLAQATLTPRALADAIAELLSDGATRARMAIAARSLGRPDAAREIVDALGTLAGR
jgi:UDP-N-acetylglucosamine--N-acetylmuramyl-(pentapeptide) pyrophosphoryl-undecaprenol N-acetylglucosamine transferase